MNSLFLQQNTVFLIFQLFKDLMLHSCIVPLVLMMHECRHSEYLNSAASFQPYWVETLRKGRHDAPMQHQRVTRRGYIDAS